MHQKSEIYSAKIFLVRDATASARRHHAAGTKRGRSRSSQFIGTRRRENYQHQPGILKPLLLLYIDRNDQL